LSKTLETTSILNKASVYAGLEPFDDCRGEAETIAGLMLEAKKEFLKRGDKLTLHGVVFTVTKATGHRTEEIKVEKRLSK
jgi:CBS domain containing-hemolysin-like protein